MSSDLFRYCANLNSTKIQGVFENCGLNYPVNVAGWINTNEGYYSTGITGRIPPYLLRPLSSITDISYMFKNCKRLSSYMKDSLIYQIPKDFFSYAPKITSLVEIFQGLAFIPSTNLTVFGALTNALDIRNTYTIVLASRDFATLQYEGQWLKINDIPCQILAIDTSTETATIKPDSPIDAGGYFVELGAVLNGYDGEVMVLVPEFWIKSWDTDTRREVRISPSKIDDTWEHQPKILIGAYHDTVLNTVPENMGYLSTLEVNSALSIVNTHDYCRGGNNDATYDDMKVAI